MRGIRRAGLRCIHALLGGGCQARMIPPPGHGLRSRSGDRQLTRTAGLGSSGAASRTPGDAGPGSGPYQVSRFPPELQTRRIAAAARHIRPPRPRVSPPGTGEGQRISVAFLLYCIADGEGVRGWSLWRRPCGTCARSVTTLLGMRSRGHGVRRSSPRWNSASSSWLRPAMPATPPGRSSCSMPCSRLAVRWWQHPRASVTRLGG
jgi:hypothetical protein